MKTYLLFFLLLVTYFMNGQTFQEIQFDNFTPSWTHYTNVDLNNNPIQSYRSKKHILSKNKMYILSNTIDIGFTGHVVEGINLETGNLLWNYFYHPISDDNNEYAANLFLNNTSTLQLLSVKKHDSNSNYWEKGVLRQRYFNLTSGEIVDSIFSNESGFKISIPSQSVKNVNLSPWKSNFQHFQLKSFLIFEKYESILFSSAGEIIEITERQKIENGQDLIKTKSLYSHENGEKIIMTYYVEYENEEKFHINVLALSPTLDTLSYFVIKDDVEKADNFKIINATKDYVLLKSLNTIYNGTFKYKKYGYYLFDINGVLLDKAFLENTNGDDKFEGGRAIKLKDENKLFCVYSGEFNGFQKLIFAKSDGNGNFKSLKEIQSTTKEDWFQCKSLTILPSNDIVINLRHSNRKYENPYAEKSVWMRISEMDIFSSVNSLPDIPSFVAYPNPTSGEITIESSSANPSKIIILDLLGIIRKELEFQKNIQLSNLPRGIYFIELLDNQNNILGNQKIILD